MQRSNEIGAHGIVVGIFHQRQTEWKRSTLERIDHLKNREKEGTLAF
jgi:hypothetical protein